MNDQEKAKFRVLVNLVDRRWEQSRPKEYQALQESGRLRRELLYKAQYAWNLAKRLSDQGVPFHEVEEVVWNDLFPISEELEEEQKRDAQEPDLLQEWFQRKNVNLLTLPDGRTVEEGSDEDLPPPMEATPTAAAAQFFPGNRIIQTSRTGVETEWTIEEVRPDGKVRASREVDGKRISLVFSPAEIRLAEPCAEAPPTAPAVPPTRTAAEPAQPTSEAPQPAAPKLLRPLPEGFGCQNTRYTKERMEAAKKRWAERHGTRLGKEAFAPRVELAAPPTEAQPPAAVQPTAPLEAAPMPSELSPPPGHYRNNPLLAKALVFGLLDQIFGALDSENFQEAQRLADEVGWDGDPENVPAVVRGYKPAWFLDRFQEQNPDFHLNLDWIYKNSQPLEVLRAVLETLLFNERLASNSGW